MANLTLADYRSSTLAFIQEDRFSPDNNRKFLTIDVDRAINAGRRQMLREVGVGFYRASDTTNATAGDIVAPADFFNEAVITYAPDARTRTVLKPVTSRYMDETNPTRLIAATGTPHSYTWNVGPDGVVVNLVPAPTSDTTDGLVWSYTKSLDDLEDDADECPVMNLFPEFQCTTIQCGAARILMLLEGGTQDDQFKKYEAILEADIAKIRASVNRLFLAHSPNTGR